MSQARATTLTGLVAALACTLGLLWPGAAALAAPRPHFDPAAAAGHCAHGRRLSAPLGARDLAFVRRFAPCVLRTERRQLGLGLHFDASLTHDQQLALAAFIASSPLRRGDARAADELYSGSEQVIGDEACHAGRPKIGNAIVDSHAPPVMTPQLIAKQFTPLFALRGDGARDPDAQFGLAIRRGLLFRGGDRGGLSLAVIVVSCRGSGSLPHGLSHTI